MKILSDTAILSSWKKNVNPWIAAIKNGEINSRIDTTNHAILDTILRLKPESVLDIGCGEGWLVRELTKSGIETLGTDAVAELIDAAKAEGRGQYKVLAYTDLSYKNHQNKYDIVVSNFSLLGNESVLDVFSNIGPLLNNNGYFVVQTIHPQAGGKNQDYHDGWREGSWAGFNDSFTDPAPWYFRTIESWRSLFENNNFIIENVLEPKKSGTEIPTSILFIGKLNNKV